ncbi:37030_t:CDS:2 [Gigaspora margarita]|uniref:37030_t:CDS:1 n=1 Tax=Gigaspora margarita TaxID=4874 RepID=A0ABN7V5Y1_GIGMA|nr:37030_t:CDS:2 [Gigaspora margarita]
MNYALNEFNNSSQEFNNFSQELDFLQEFNDSLQKSDNSLQEFDLQKESNNSLQELDLQKEFDNSLQELDLQRSNNYLQELGNYPKDSSTLKYTLAPNRYEISDNYIVETIWGRKTNKLTIKLQINYVSSIPTFYIYFGPKFKNYVVSNKSPSHAATLLY